MMKFTKLAPKSSSDELVLEFHARGNNLPTTFCTRIIRIDPHESLVEGGRIKY